MKCLIKYILILEFVLVPKTYFGQNVNEIKQCALECQQQLDFKAAISEFDKLLKLSPKDTVTYIDRALAKEYVLNYVGAIADYTEVTKLDSENPDGYFLRALVEEKIHDYDNAISDYEKALSIEGDNADANYHLGLCFVQKKRYDEALKYYDKAFEANQEHINSLAAKAWLEITLNNSKEAMVLCNKAISINSSHAMTNAALAYLSCKEGLYNQAVKHYLVAIKNNLPESDTMDIDTSSKKQLHIALTNYCKQNSFTNDSVYAYIGILYSLLNEYRMAVTYFNKASRHIFNQMALYNCALSYIRLNDYKNTINQLNLLLNKNATDENAYLLRAEAYESLHENRNALLDYNMAILINPYNPLSFWKRSKLKYIMGYQVDSCDDLKKSKELGIFFLLKPDFSICP